ncbi:MAG: ATP-dependent helicase UvrD/PcrA [Solirubrobacteraceae bacterium]|nr:ATP-dependent helicase UvrD/PcrA [Solirubrobacteraceae bacterium]
MWPLAGLSDAQQDAVRHRRAPLLILGGPGSGKTEVLVRRLAWLIEQGSPAAGVLLLTHGERRAGDLRLRAEAALRGPHEEAEVHTVHGFCARLLADEALEAGLDPFAVAATAADRLAMLLERVDELDLRHHDFRGRPAALLGSFLRRIDRLKDELVDAARYADWAAAHHDALSPREREFAHIFLAHDRMLAERGALDAGDLLLHTARLLAGEPAPGARVARRWPILLVDDWQDLSFGEAEVILRLERAGAALTAAALAAPDPGRAIPGGRGPHLPPGRPPAAAAIPGAAVIELTASLRCPPPVVAAARAVLGEPPSAGPRLLQDDGIVRFWRCANERTQAQSVAAELERLIGRESIAPERLAVLVRSVADEGQAVAVALAERSVPYRVIGSDAFFQRVEIRDVIAWLRLLVDPRDAGAVVRALARPPVELNSIDIARCVQIARRRKLDMVAALVAATESPQLPPEARERIAGFLRLYRAAAAALDNTRPDLFVHRLIDRIGLRRQHLFTARADVVERLVNLAKLGEMAASHARRAPQSTPREFARYIAAVADAGLGEEEAVAATGPGAVAVLAMDAAAGLEFDHVFVLGLHAARMPGTPAGVLEPVPAELIGRPAPAASHAAGMRGLLALAISRARRGVVLAHAASSARGAVQSPSPFLEDARAAVAADWEDREEELFGPAEALHSTFRELRDELLESVARIGGRLGELRLDTDLDISHGAVRFLELVKLAALLERPDGQPIDEALGDINARLGQAATPLQREIFETSPLDGLLLGADRDERGRAATRAAREEPSLEPFLPRRGAGLVLSASDIETYRTCPLKYKFARVLRIPQEPTLNQRFGILVHQVLERFHATGSAGEDAMLGLLDAAWRRGGFGDSDEERQLREKARAALLRYGDRLEEEPIEPRWFERSFAFALGPHHIRGRVDRVDALPGGGYRLIDYKTGVPRTPDELREDIQLALYAVGAREAWDIEAAERSYYYVLDDVQVAVPNAADATAWIRETVLEVGEGILAQGFEPTPSLAACSWCDFRIACPAAER